MWTPRRVILLLVSMAFFGLGFATYARFLGWIDGLPKLPEELLARRAADESLPPASMSMTERKLQLAFGANCVEVGYKYKIELPSKGLVFASDAYSIEPDGRLRFSPFSLATLKEKAPGVYPEINSAHGDIAYLEFDKPVKALSEIGARRIVACEIVSDPGLLSHDPRRGQVHIFNNRGTEKADDDLSLVTAGPVYYHEMSQEQPLEKSRPHLWTGAAVRLVDRRGPLEPTTITSQGMQVFLAIDAPEQKPAKDSKPKGSSITGVRRVVLPTNVSMDIWMDPSSGFLATGAAKSPEAKPATAPAAKASETSVAANKAADGKTQEKPKERSNLQITTLGPFTYDIGESADRARFDRLPPSATQLPNFVRVVRPQTRGGQAVVYDQLECDTLELQFAHRPKAEPGKPVPKNNPEQSEHSTIEWVHAWGDLIVLTSDEEKLEARGNDLFHDAKSKKSVLKGTPEMVAVKEGNEIHAPELHLFGVNAKDGQQAKAVGVGYVKLYERNGNARAVEARWKESLQYRKDEGRDLLTLTGSATFEDREQAQLLQADQLVLLLAAQAPVAGAVKPAKTGETPPSSRPRPQKLDAIGHVTARSPDLHIDDTDALVLLFKDAPPRENPVAPAAAPAATSPAAPGANPPAAAAAKPAQDPLKKPIQLKAKRVQAFVLVRPGEANELDTVHCEDDVRIHQDPATPAEKPIDMRGQKITLNHKLEGNVLQVAGTLDSPGEVHFPDLSLLGPSITIDQINNQANVNGIGSMKIVSTTGLNGEKLKQPSDLVVTWKQEMRFNGQLAQFHGNVQAEQDATTLLCSNMQVFLSKPVQLNRRPDSARGSKEPANIDRVVCDDSGMMPPQPVRITEQLKDDRGKLVKYQQIESNAIAMYKEEGQVEAGPGYVRILQLGLKDERGGPLGVGPAKAKTNAPAKPPEEEHKLTWVRYGGTMKVNNPQRTAKFYKNVEVLHFPWEDPGHNLVMNKLIDKLPPGGMYLRCQQLGVYSTRESSGKLTQRMEAEGKAYVQAQDFFGWASVIKYDESKQQVIFEGSDGGLAELNRVLVKGQKPDTVKAKKITYNRLTGALSTDGTKVINSGG